MEWKAQQFSGQSAVRRVEELAREGRLAVLTDLDGTLTKAPPGVHDTVTPDRELEDTLNVLYDRSGGAFVVITGRPQIFVANLMPGGRFPVATEHGAVISGSAAEQGSVRAARYDFNLISREISVRIAHIEGAYVEKHKTATLTLQFTGAADPESVREFMENLMEEAVRRHGDPSSSDPLKVVSGCVKGNYTIDIIPESADKAEAVRYYMGRPEMAGRVPVFCGDSGGDRTAMELVKSLGGAAIGVGPQAPACADIGLADVAAMRRFFRHIARLMPAPSGPAPRPA